MTTDAKAKLWKGVRHGIPTRIMAIEAECVVTHDAMGETVKIALDESEAREAWFDAIRDASYYSMLVDALEFAFPDIVPVEDDHERGAVDCPHGEPLHYHHDGCPACYLAEKDEAAENQGDK